MNDDLAELFSSNRASCGCITHMLISTKFVYIDPRGCDMVMSSKFYWIDEEFATIPFEDVFYEISPEIQEKLLFHLDFIIPGKKR
jgi:hypothetical protein